VLRDSIIPSLTSDVSQISSTPTIASTPTNQTSTPSPTPSPTRTFTAAELQVPVPERAKVRDGKPVVYLTFDDGPSANSALVLAVLAKHQAHATFFVVGDRVKRAPVMVRAELAAGHAVGGHSWNHAHLTTLPSDQVESQLSRTAAIIRAQGGTARCFRPPFGETDAMVKSVAGSLHLHEYLWTAESKDWTKSSASSDLAIAKAGLKPGAVIVFHDGRASGSPDSLKAVDQFLSYAEQQGYVADALPC